MIYRSALSLLLALLVLTGCGSTSGPSATADSDHDGVVDAFDAHPDQRVPLDRQIEQVVKAHAGKPGLITAQIVGQRVDACGQSPAVAAEIAARDPQRDGC